MFVKLGSLEEVPTTWLWPGLIPSGAISIIAGEAGKGKSTLLADITARVTTGSPMPFSDEPGKPGSVLLVSGEDSASTIRQNLQANGADLMRVSVLDRSEGKSLILPDAIPEIEEWIRRENGCSVICDPVATFMKGSPNAESSVRKAIDPLAEMAERTGVAVILVRHLNKSGGKNIWQRLAGSHVWNAAIRSGLLVADDTTSNLVDPQNQNRVVAQFKSNLGPIAPSLSFRLVGGENGVKTEWQGRSELTYEQLLDSEEMGEAQQEACELLCSQLRDGPVRVKVVRSNAAEHGISWRTVRRAKKVLGVLVMPNYTKGDIHYTWMLPEGNPLVEKFKSKQVDDLIDLLFRGGPQKDSDVESNEESSALLPRAGIDMDGTTDDDQDAGIRGLDG